MKKLVLCGIVGIIGLAFCATPSFSATCGLMEVVSTAASTNASSGAEVWLRNVSGVDCGTLKNGDAKLFNLAPDTADKTMAVILTAISLGKKVWCAYDDSTDPGLLQIISIQAGN